LIRRQLSLFLPEPERSAVDEVRRKYDRNQFDIIPAHVTLCGDDEIEPWSGVADALNSIKQVNIVLSLGGATRLQDGCVLIPVAGSASSYDQVRRQILGERYKPRTPHITLLHPRNSAGKAHLFSAMKEEVLPAFVRLNEIALIEQVDGGVWNVVERYGAGTRR
jgi:2'-5' RNA ligase